jgi:cytidylate kinase
MIEQTHSLERCQAFINSNFVQGRQEPKRLHKAVTISRQAYSQSHAIAEELIRLVQRDRQLGEHAWALFDRDLVHRILEDHHLPKTLERYMPEDKDRNLTGLINEILGLHPSQWELFHYTCDTILKLARVGNVILIGRGAHIVTRGVPHMLHVRIIAPLDERIRRASEHLQISHAEAVKRLRQDDAARDAYVRSHFDEGLDRPLAYHLTLNSGQLSVPKAASILYAALRDG